MSQYIFVFHLEPPNNAIRMPFEEITQFLKVCHSPNFPDYMFSLGGEAFRHM